MPHRFMLLGPEPPNLAVRELQRRDRLLPDRLCLAGKNTLLTHKGSRADTHRRRSRRAVGRDKTILVWLPCESLLYVGTWWRWAHSWRRAVTFRLQAVR